MVGISSCSTRSQSVFTAPGDHQTGTRYRKDYAPLPNGDYGRFKDEFCYDNLALLGQLSTRFIPRNVGRIVE